MSGTHFAHHAEETASAAVSKHGPKYGRLDLRLHVLRELAPQRQVVAHVGLFDGRARQAGENGDPVQSALGLLGRNLLRGKHAGDDRTLKDERRNLLAVMFNRLVQHDRNCIARDLSRLFVSGFQSVKECIAQSRYPNIILATRFGHAGCRIAGRAATGLITALTLNLQAAGQQPPPSEIDRLLPPPSSELSYYKWVNGAPIRLLVVTGKQSGSCVDTTVARIRREASRIRALVPQLRNLLDPEPIEWVPQTRIASPLLIGLEMENEAIEQAMPQFAKYNSPRAQLHGRERSGRATAFGEGFGTESGRIVLSYSWITSAGGLAKLPEKVCQSSTWYDDVLTGQLGRQNFRPVSSIWVQTLPVGQREHVKAAIGRLYLKALYACPGSPADRDCVRRELSAFVSDPTLMRH